MLFPHKQDIYIFYLFYGDLPVDVSEEGVNLSVMPQHAHRLSQRPLWGGVGAEAAVVDREPALEARVHEVLVEGTERVRVDHALVGNGLLAE